MRLIRLTLPPRRLRWHRRSTLVRYDAALLPEQGVGKDHRVARDGGHVCCRDVGVVVVVNVAFAWGAREEGCCALARDGGGVEDVQVPVSGAC